MRCPNPVGVGVLAEPMIRTVITCRRGVRPIWRRFGDHVRHSRQHGDDVSDHIGYRPGNAAGPAAPRLCWKPGQPLSEGHSLVFERSQRVTEEARRHLVILRGRGDQETRRTIARPSQPFNPTVCKAVASNRGSLAMSSNTCRTPRTRSSELSGSMTAPLRTTLSMTITVPGWLNASDAARYTGLLGLSASMNTKSNGATPLSMSR